MPTTSGTGPAMAIYEVKKRMRKILIRVMDKKVIVCVGVVGCDFSRSECDGSGKDSVMFVGADTRKIWAICMALFGVAFIT